MWCWGIITVYISLLFPLANHHSTHTEGPKHVQHADVNDTFREGEREEMGCLPKRVHGCAADVAPGTLDNDPTALTADTNRPDPDDCHKEGLGPGALHHHRHTTSTTTTGTCTGVLDPAAPPSSACSLQRIYQNRVHDISKWRRSISRQPTQYHRHPQHHRGHHHRQASAPSTSTTRWVASTMPMAPSYFRTTPLLRSAQHSAWYRARF